MPAAHDLEKIVISSMWQEPDFAIPKAMRILGREDFNIDANGLLFATLCEEFDAGKATDLPAITQRLMDRGQLDDAGGFGYLTDVFAAAIGAAHVEHHARQVRVKSRCRAVIDAGLRGINALFAEPTAEKLKEVAGSIVDDVLRATLDEERAKIVHIREAIMDGVQELEEAIANRGHVTGEIATGFTDLDRMFIQGLRRTENITIAGDTSMGKTSLAVQILNNITTGTGHYRQFYNFDQKHVDDWQGEVSAGRAKSRFGKKMAVMICLESSQIETALKLLMSRAEINVGEIQRGMISREDQQGIHTQCAVLHDSMFWIWDAAGCDVEEIGAELKAFKMAHPELAAVCVDHCGLLGARGIKDKGNETAIAGYVSNYLRNLWKRLDVVGLTLWQLNRDAARKGGNGKPPTLADLRSSGRIEQDATKVMMPFRPGHYDDEADDSEAYIVVAKNRGGPRSPGGIQMRWQGEYTRFYSEQKDDQGVWRPRLQLFSLKESERQVK